MSGRAGSWLLATLLPLVYLGLLRLDLVPPGADSGDDSFYHVAMADSFRERCLARRMPEMTLSAWEERFYDKELGYHFLLAAVRRAGRMVGLRSGPPFDGPAVCLAALALGAMALLVVAERVPRPWRFTLLLAGVSPTFLQRLQLLRPHVLAIALVLAAALAYGRYRGLRDGWLAVLVGALFAWSYSNPHFALLPALAYWLSGGREGLRRLWTLPALTAAGVALGLTAHPQFPNTWWVWKVQSVDVVRQILLRRAPVLLGDEMRGPGGVWLLVNLPLLALGLATLVGAAAAIRRGGVSPGRTTRAFLLMAAVTLPGLLVSVRAVEHAGPAVVGASALLWRDLGWRLEGRARLAMRVAGWVSLLALLAWSGLWYRVVAGRYQLAMDGFGAWARGHLEPGTVIANPNWSDFPRLLYSAPGYRFSLGLDPLFGYRRDPERMARLEAFRTGRLRLAPRELRELVRARYIVLARENGPLARSLGEQGYVRAYQGPDGWVFDLHGADDGKRSTADGSWRRR